MQTQAGGVSRPGRNYARHVDRDKLAPQNNFVLLIMLHSLTTQLQNVSVRENNYKIEELKGLSREKSAGIFFFFCGHAKQFFGRLRAAEPLWRDIQWICD
jgi:hypothetical protein